ncbi:MAG: efflux RND transporter periplasmic adaptor subunit [Desulfuromonadaceae bacterium]|nr:efflux RND transporter periplasmic adaptor subunit [Desulfuromonadaceae bacterium]MDD2856265.1 efflux RND transporter periplasmic adaptor subunit [Desulfuromonadaceae bacterium]
MRRSLLLLTLLSSALFAAGGCSKNHEGAKTDNRPVPVLKGMTVETVKNMATPELLDIVGTVRARTSAVVSPRIPGSISFLTVREGDRVKKGQLLMQLDARENQANAAAASAAVDEAHRAMDEAISRKKLADITFERYQNLLNEQAVSRQEFDVRQTERDMATQAVARAESRLKQSQEGAKGAAALSDYTRITAPISGVIASKQGDLGATVFPGQPLLTIEDEGSYQLELAVPENFAGKIKAGTELQVNIDSINAVFTGRITETVPTADAATRTFIAKVPLNRIGLKSGMFGRASLPLSTTVMGVTVPVLSVLERGALTSVWTLDAENNTHLRIVKTGRVGNGRIEILSGLTDGDRVVTSAVEKVTEGAKVE